MEYVFGTKEDKEVLRTKGNSHSKLDGFHQLVREYPDQTVTDSFRIVGKIDRAEDGDGNCYDWYEIDHHIRYTDKFTPKREEIEAGIAESQDAVCILSVELDDRISDLENALCELTQEV